MKNKINKAYLIDLYQSLDLKKPRITKGMKWRNFKIVNIEKLNNDDQIDLHDGDCKEFKSWETIKRINNDCVKSDLKHLLKPNYEMEQDDLNYFLNEYKKLSNFYYDNKSVDYLTSFENSLENISK